MPVKVTIKHGAAPALDAQAASTGNATMQLLMMLILSRAAARVDAQPILSAGYPWISLRGIPKNPHVC